jgi:transposase
MLGLTRRVRVFAAPLPVDMRKSFYTLSAIVQQSGHDIVTGDVFLFVGRCRKRAKALWFDGTGLVLLAKRLERGRFSAIWERAKEGLAELTTSELMVFLEGSEVVGKASIVEATFSFDKASDSS